MNQPHPKFPLKAFISVVMHFPHVGREQEFGYRAGLTDKSISISTACGVYNYNSFMQLEFQYCAKLGGNFGGQVRGFNHLPC